MSSENQQKWDSAAGLYDLTGGFGPEKRWKGHKTKLFSSMKGNILFMAVGTGLDIACFPQGQQITGIDISPKMLERARPRVASYSGQMTVRQMDIHKMDFEDATFDQVYTSCTFCSVPDPLKGLTGIRRVLKPGGTLHMFEHTGSRIFPFSAMLNFMNPLCRSLGPEINRDTVANVREAGFLVNRVTNVYLDVVKTIEATAPAS
ncbi:MAG: class I SAM-dependent methyltransferase [Rhodospirillales bacterium]|nr:class I SAM-dependent methyltransferase [Rhodospirillales bacterium]